MLQSNDKLKKTRKETKINQLDPELPEKRTEELWGRGKWGVNHSFNREKIEKWDR